LTNVDGDDKNTLLIVLLTRVLSWLFNSVVFKEVRIAIFLLPPKGTLFKERNEEQKGVRMEGSKLYVGNLSYSITKEQVEELFSNYGEVVQVTIIEGKGFGFVEMSDSTEAAKAREVLNGSDFEGRTLKVDEARPSRPKGGQRRGFRGGGQRGGGGGYGRY
jgi:RNA recognition motif-containing protein